VTPHRFTTGCPSCAAIAAALARELPAGTTIETDLDTTTANAIVLVTISPDATTARCHGWVTRDEFDSYRPDWHPMDTLDADRVFAYIGREMVCDGD
jgi:hypothetical protein